MATAISCETCGRYIRKNAYRKHLRGAHGIGTGDAHVPRASLPQPDAAKPSAGLHVHGAKKVSVSQAHPPQSNHAYRGHPTNPLHGQSVSRRVTASIEPSKEHRDALDQIFIAPEFCLYLLLIHQPEIRTRVDAQMFLLNYKRAIDGYLPLRNRGALIDLLSDFMLQWSMHFPDQIRLNFDCEFVISGRNAFARIKGIGDILLNARSIKGELPSSSRVFSVMIEKRQENYSLDFVYEDSVVEPAAPTARIRCRAPEDGTQVAMPALKLRADRKKKEVRAGTQDLSAILTKRITSSPRIARQVRSLADQLEYCPLCGKGVEHGGMLMHKRDAHGETMYSPSPLQTVRRCAWVAIYQGGAPGLGKGKS